MLEIQLFSNTSIVKESESKQKALETSLSQNEKERMDSIQEKLQNITAENSASNKTITNDEKTPLSTSQLKPAKSFQLLKEKGNADDLRSMPHKKVKLDASVTNKVTEETSNSPAMTSNTEKNNENAEISDTVKEKPADEASSNVKTISVTKVVKPLVLTPVSEAKQV